MILSGIAGVAVGGQSAVAGWWLIVVFTGLLLLTFVGGEPGAATGQSGSNALGSRLTKVLLVIVAVVVIVPITLLMLAGGA